MLIEQTLDKLNAMKLAAMADAWRQQIQTDEAAALGVDERRQPRRRPKRVSHSTLDAAVGGAHRNHRHPLRCSPTRQHE